MKIEIVENIQMFLFVVVIMHSATPSLVKGMSLEVKEKNYIS